MGAGHPESPARLFSIEEHLQNSGVNLDVFLTCCEASLATEDELARIHTREAIHRIKESTPAAGYCPIDSDTLLNPFSWTAACAAAGAALTATKAVLEGKFANAFCSIRPPGHHATPEAAMGFCLFNNIALAANYALDQHGLERIAIVDFDVHHGNGTQTVFEDDPRVLMVGFFQHPCYPFSGLNSTSKYMHNCPVPAYTDGASIRSLIDQHWLPALHAHQPQMIFISAGFDAHCEDTIGQMDLVEADYEWITAQVMQVAKQYSHGRIVSCLEGGYNLSALGRSVAAHISVLAGLKN
jgi:acetoin utilization deacetylase AcuC-like enzyme